MATTIKQTESLPTTYQAVGAYGSGAAALIWQRIEPYIAYRWSPRDVTWIIEGPGEWHPPLTPVTPSGGLMVWSCGAQIWEGVTVDASPLGGYYLPCTGPYKFQAVVGTSADAVVPTAVQEAFTRLGAHMDAKPGKPGATSESVTAGSIAVSSRRSASWMANALQDSGAADLLRPYRRV